MLRRAPGGRGLPQQIHRRPRSPKRREQVRQGVVAIKARSKAKNIARGDEPIEGLSRARGGIGPAPQGWRAFIDGPEIPQGAVQHGRERSEWQPCPGESALRSPRGHELSQRCVRRHGQRNARWRGWLMRRIKLSIPG